jgi:hypothetical protein
MEVSDKRRKEKLKKTWIDIIIASLKSQLYGGKTLVTDFHAKDLDGRRTPGLAGWISIHAYRFSNATPIGPQ